VALRTRIGRRQLEQLLASGARFRLDGRDPREIVREGFTEPKRREPLHERHIGVEGA